MHRIIIQKLCICFFSVIAAFTLGGCTVGINDVDGNNAPTPATVTVNAGNVTNDSREPSRLQSIQDKVSVQHR